MSRDVWARLSGDQLVSENVGYDIEHVEHGDGEAYSIDLTLDLGGLDVVVEFPLEDETAEEFLVAFRDEIVRGKRAKLKWETDTDPESGVYDPDEEACEP